MAFVWWERHARKPMLALHLFNNRNFVMLNIVTLLYGALISSGVYTVLFLNQTAGYSATAAGLAAAGPIIVLFFLTKPSAPSPTATHRASSSGLGAVLRDAGPNPERPTTELDQPAGARASSTTTLHHQPP